MAELIPELASLRAIIRRRFGLPSVTASSGPLSRAPRAGSVQGVDYLRPQVAFVFASEPLASTPVLFHAALCVLVQGAKRASVGGRQYRYEAGSYLLSALSLLADSEVLEATPEQPLLGIVLDLDLRLLARLMVELDDGHPPASPPRVESALVAHSIDAPLASALARLAAVATHDTQWRLLADGLLREVYYHLLVGPAGDLLRERVARAGNLERIAQAIDFIERNLTSSIEVERLARAVGMSPSSLHAQFKAVTSHSPMQFVKRLRLARARTALLAGKSATEAAFESGYHSASQFSRDFRRHFGVPPSKLSRAS